MSEPTWIGRSLNNRYKIESLLGQGGMSAVYKATDPNLRRTVAIKLIHPHLSSDTSFLQRFEEEAAAVASLRHPNIVQVFDFNSDGDTHYMVLEFVPGETLENRLERISRLGGRLPFNEAIHHTLNICSALGYAHQRGMIHRDIKPANIMINAEGQAILMDFGIVKILGGTSHTMTGTIIGTASYMPPEIIKSEPADQRSDIYSLGITLYEMLSGKVPFHSDSAMSLMMMHINNPVPDPRDVRPELTPGMVDVLFKCLEKEPDHRYQNAGELAADLKLALTEIEATYRDDSTHRTPIEIAQKFAKVEETASKPAAPAKPTAETNQQANQGWQWFVAAGLLFFIAIILIWGTIFLFRNQAQGLAKPTQVAPVNTQVGAGPLINPTSATATPVSTLTAVPRSTSTPADDRVGYGPAPTNMPGMTEGPTLDPKVTTSPANVSVKITGISIAGSKYVVQYQTNGFVPNLTSGIHLHFYFNNVAPEDAGMPGSGPWKMYGGPQPFTGYSVSQRPEGVTQLCAAVANPDHTIIQGTASCFDLP